MVDLIMHETHTRGLRSDPRFTSDYRKVGMSECQELKSCSVRPALAYMWSMLAYMSSMFAYMPSVLAYMPPMLAFMPSMLAFMSSMLAYMPYMLAFCPLC